MKYLVSLSAEEVVAKFRELPEVATRREFAVVPTRRGFDVRRTWKHPPYEEPELAPLELRVSLTPDPRGTRVSARTTSMPNLRGIAAAFAVTLWGAGGNLIFEALNIGETRERRRRERSELLNLVGRVLAEHEFRESEAPYR